MYLFYNIYTLCVIVTFAGAHLSLYEGQICPYQERTGVCSYLKNCPNLSPTEFRTAPICSFNGTQPIICCPVNDVEVITTEASRTGWTTIDINKLVTDQKNSIIWDFNRKNGNDFKVTDKSSNIKEQEKLSETWCKKYTKTICPTRARRSTEHIGVRMDKLKEEDELDAHIRIVNGTNVELGEYPHMALVGFGEKNPVYQCGGSLISNRFVLTAAHCLDSRELGLAHWVRLGVHNKSMPSDGVLSIEVVVSERIRHPDYIPPSRYNDIGLLKLLNIVQFNANIHPACLQNRFDISQTRAFATGWGNIEYSVVDRTSEILQKVALEFFDFDQCNNTFKANLHGRSLKKGIVSESQLCAGGIKYKADTCQGDSGGPLQVGSKSDCLWTIVGITSFGQACGTAGVPGVYTRVSHYITWIENIVWA